jgi:hypothetical protein
MLLLDWKKALLLLLRMLPLRPALRYILLGLLLLLVMGLLQPGCCQSRPCG